jgi:UDP-glucuronate 4-epimerase
MRDFTYIDDIVDGVLNTIQVIPKVDSSEFSNACAPYKIYNIGNNKPIKLARFISAIEESCGIKAKKNLLPMQSGDVPSTYADIAEFTENTDFTPKTEIEDGISSFVLWYKSFVSTTLKSEVLKK